MPNALVLASDDVDDELREKRERRVSRDIAIVAMEEERNRRLDEATCEEDMEQAMRWVNQTCANMAMEEERARRVSDSPEKLDSAAAHQARLERQASTKVAIEAMEMERLRRLIVALPDDSFERRENMWLADMAMEGERKRRLSKDEREKANVEVTTLLERRRSQVIADKAMEKERARRMSESESEAQAIGLERRNSREAADFAMEIERARRLSGEVSGSA